ncbi:hypothetical protein H2200_000541 [Cladophialophora chaetospira]|uniref:Enoyl reductase (ER) domain-containing protein n=1 Tax=Cladophialophora chaetospira TaxID=386627 RepID=A0AA38XNR1_9EURO|nr:hypothetical protein H2200_000541 [Cladophialophora chaetospira]
MAPSPTTTTSQLHLMQKGGPFEFAQVPKPAPAPDQILVRQHATAINGLDLKQRDTGLFIPRWPHVLGIEGAGIVEAVGSDVRDFKPGDEVMACLAGRARGEDWGGSYQEHVNVPIDFFVAKKPKNISFEEAASLPIGYVTAVCAILDGLKIPLPFLPQTANSRHVPSSVLILGGSSATGAAALQLLRLGYPSLPIYATSSPGNFARLRSLGATQVFDYRSPSIVADIRAHQTPGSKGIDMIADFVSAGASQTDICEVLDPAGSKIYAALVTGVPVPVRDGVTHVEVDGWSIVDMQGGKSILPALTGLVEQGKYKLPVSVKVAGHGLEQIPKVMDEVLNLSGEKLVVKL